MREITVKRPYAIHVHRSDMQRALLRDQSIEQRVSFDADGKMDPLFITVSVIVLINAA